jgi:hypothetical protein
MGCDVIDIAASLDQTAEGDGPHMSMSQTKPEFPPVQRTQRMGALIRGEIKVGQRLAVMASTAVPESCQMMQATCATRTEECPRA